MKKIFVLLLVALFLPCNVFADSSNVFVSNDAARAVMESTLKNGFSQNKDVQTMIDNAFLNGFDYVEIEISDNGAMNIKVAINGLASALPALKNGEGAEVKEMLLSHCATIDRLLQTIGRDDISFMFTILDDRPLVEFGLSDVDLVKIAIVNGEVKRFFSMVDLP